ncbi:MAG: hypothetical protein K0S65_535 [Labilithrix sp.]|nr:hypothetical protein [Labilithrix sp.]
MVGAGKQEEPSAPRPSRDAAIESALGVLERQRLSFIEVLHEELGAGPEVDERGPTIVDLVDDEEAAVRSRKTRGNGAFAFAEALCRLNPETLGSEGIIPEGAGAVLEPGIFGAERSRSMLEVLPHPGRTFGEIADIPEADDGLVRCDHHGRRGILRRAQRPPPLECVVPMRNRVFFPQACLDQWGIEGKIELTPTELVILAEGRRYEITEVVRVVVEVTGSPDPHDIIGKVKSKAELEGIGAEILENSMIIGDNAYDVVPGWAGAPQIPFEDHLLSPERITARSGITDIATGPNSDEDMLARFAQGTL